MSPSLKPWVFLLIGLVLSASCTRTQDSKPRLRILTYSSLGSPGGFLDKSKAKFLEKSGCQLEVETTLGAAQVLSYLEEPKQLEWIDVVMGLDEVLWERAQSSLYPVSIFTEADQPRWHSWIKTLAHSGFYPTDYAALSFIYKKDSIQELPKTLADLAKPQFKNRFIVQDPRVSSPGLLFFLFAEGLVPTETLARQWLALAPSWDASYKMFLAGEAPMVWSYLTSLAYHDSKGELQNYGFVEFQEGLPVQVEGMSLVKKNGNPVDQNKCIRPWFDFVFSEAGQTLLAESQFMMPVIQTVPVPKSLKAVPSPKKTAVLKQELDRVDRLVTQFGKRIRK